MTLNMALTTKQHPIVEAKSAGRLHPYYLRQTNDSSCSLASATIIVNAARAALLHRPQPLSQEQVQDIADDSLWNDAVAPDGNGVSLDVYRGILTKVLRRVGLRRSMVHSVHATRADLVALSHFNTDLRATFERDHLYMVANFDLNHFFNYGQMSGHLSPIGTYDQKNQRVQVLDVEPTTGHPYWVSAVRLLKAMNTLDEKLFRGYLMVAPAL